MKTLVSTVCLVITCFAPLPAVAAEGGSLSFSSLFPSFCVAAVLFIATLFLRLRFRRYAQDKNELALRLRLTDQALDRVPLPILRLDAGLRVVAANQSALATYTHAQGSLIGVGLLDLLPELADHPDILAVQAAADEREELPDGVDPEQARQDTDGSGKLVTITVQGRSRMFWFGTASTWQNQTQSAEDAAGRMKSEFVANINHEVRTPLNAIIGYTEMLANAQLGSKEKRFVTIIHKSSMALVSIFNDIMELSKIESDRLHITVASVRLQSIANDITVLFKELSEERGLCFHCRVGDDLPEYIRFDGMRLKQILQNLVGNAVKFTNAGAVTLEIDGIPSKSKPGCLDLRVVVEDTGIGISEANQQRIINLFNQEQEIEKHFDGVGLGLTLCSRLTVMMGGRIQLASKEGAGTKFTLLFDEVEMIESLPVMHEVPVNAPRQEGKKKLLVVDDVDLIKIFFFDFFQDSPYQVFTAANGTEAVAIARSERPDLIFMDLNLSDSDGREVTRQLREYPGTASIPVIVMTGHLLKESDYLPLFDDLLQKPFRLEKLQEMVDRYAPAVSAATSQPVHGDDSKGEDEQILVLLGSDAWNDELETLRQQAVVSGKLTDAAALGAYMQQRGMAMQQPLLTRLGEELLRYAQDPDIMGMDRMIAKLSQRENRSNS